MAITITAIKAHSYAGKRRKPGDTYNARGESDARLVEALSWGIRAPAAAPVIEQPRMLPTYQTRAMTAEAPEPVKVKRKYTKRAQAEAETTDEPVADTVQAEADPAVETPPDPVED